MEIEEEIKKEYDLLQNKVKKNLLEIENRNQNIHELENRLNNLEKKINVFKTEATHAKKQFFYQKYKLFIFIIGLIIFFTLILITLKQLSHQNIDH